MSPADIALEAARALAVEQGWTPVEGVRMQEQSPNAPRYLFIARLDDQAVAYGLDDLPEAEEARALGRYFARCFGRGRGEAVRLLAKDRALASEGGAQ